MSDFREAKSAFYKAVALNGWQRPDELQGDWPPQAPRWLHDYYAIKPIPDSQLRLINHFSIGADPEFVFMRPAFENDNVQRYDANNLGLKQGLAYGADNNGRLVELRPKPSRYALEVLASLWSAMKWMSLMLPQSLNFCWRAGAYLHADGLGGHIHFGRKRPNRERTVDALDTACYWLYMTGVYNQKEGRARYANTQYGRMRDIRPQAHGFEYRTMPSWLDSPWSAYLSLVLAKLSAHDPEFFPPPEPKWDTQFGTAVWRARIKAILAYYRGRDDDAALAYNALAMHGLPVADISDFKPRWGIIGGGQIGNLKPASKVDFVPPEIEPTPAEVREIGAALLEHRAPLIQTLEPTWQPSALPTGYHWMMPSVTTYHVKNIGEVFAGICDHDMARIIPAMTDGDFKNTSIYVTNSFAKLLDMKALKTACDGVCTIKPDADRGDNANVHRMWLSGRLMADHREWLTALLADSGLFPMWRVGDVKPNSAEMWRTLRMAKPDTAKPTSAFRGSKLFFEGGK